MACSGRFVFVRNTGVNASVASPGMSAHTKANKAIKVLIIKDVTGKSALYPMGLCSEHLDLVGVLARASILDIALAASASLRAGPANVHCGEQEWPSSIPGRKSFTRERTGNFANVWRVIGKPPYWDRQPQHEHADSIKHTWLLCRYCLYALCFGSSMASSEYASTVVGFSGRPLFQRYLIFCGYCNSASLVIVLLSFGRPLLQRNACREEVQWQSRSSEVRFRSGKLRTT